MPKISRNITAASVESGIALTDKQRLFAEYYTGLREGSIGNGLQSAKNAGYNGNEKTLISISCENLIKPSIKEYMSFILKKALLTDAKADSTLYELMSTGDNSTRVKAVQEYNKLTNRYAPSQSLNVFVNANDLFSQLQNDDKRVIIQQNS